MMALATVSVLETNFQNPKISIDKTVGLMSAGNQQFDGTVYFLRLMGLATKNSTNHTFTFKKILQQEMS